MSQARLPRTEPSTELITAHKVNTATLIPPVQTRDFSALPKHRAPHGHARPARERCHLGPLCVWVTWCGFVKNSLRPLPHRGCGSPRAQS